MSRSDAHVPSMMCIGREWRLCEGAADGIVADLELPTWSTSRSLGRDKADHSKGDVLMANPVRAAFRHIHLRCRMHHQDILHELRRVDHSLHTRIRHRRIPAAFLLAAPPARPAFNEQAAGILSLASKLEWEVKDIRPPRSLAYVSCSLCLLQ